MRVTAKGQVTIPVEIREQFGLQPGTEVAFRVEGDAVRLVKAAGASTRGRSVVDHLRRKRGRVTMSTAEIMRLTRGDE